MKKLISVLLCLCLSFALVACNPIDNGTTVKIEVMTGEDNGLGLQWSDVMKEKVEEALKDKQYGDKVGVTWDNINQEGRIGNFSTDTAHIYFTNGATIMQGLANEAYLELTDVYKRTEVRNGETITIEDKIYEEMRSTYGIKQNDGSWRYYGLPYQEYYCGLSYNRALWKKYGFYFVTEDYPDAVEIKCDDFGKSFYVAGSNGDEMSSDALDYITPGPDGNLETDYDNGLPSSWFEFITLCDYMAYVGVDPVALSGEYINYANSMLEGMYENLLGNDRTATTRSLTGELDVVVGYENEPLFPVNSSSSLYNIKKPKVQRITITEDSGYYTSWTMEKYFTTLLVQIFENYSWWSKKTVDARLSHLKTQKEFLYGVYRPDKEIAMLSEFSYWQNESIIRANYDEVIYNSNGLMSGINDVDISWMPLPVNIEHQVTGEDQEVAISCVSSVGNTPITENTAGDKPTLITLVGSLNTVVAVNAFNVQPGTKVYDAVIDALAVVYSDDCLSAATASSGQFWTLDYSLTDDDKLVATKFYNDIDTMRKAGKTFYQVSESEAYNKNMGQLFQHGFGTRIFGFGSAHHNAVEIYKLPNTRISQKQWVQDANKHIPYETERESKYLRTGTMMFEELMIDYSAWKGANGGVATIVDNARYAPCYDNGGYDG
ncbi:MAG: hypothetical protein IKV61_01545 [Clostridia bacterium]|nr:hypothetical protein [Clostridia bacterium]